LLHRQRTPCPNPRNPRPLKQRYPWVKTKEDSVTIAIGMPYDFGVLLCADTQHETYTLKTHGPKVGSFDCPGGIVGYAMAGHGPFAKSAIKKCEKRLKQRTTESIAELLEQELETEYRRNVFQHPSQATDHSLAYWFLLSVWSNDDGLKLYSTWQTSMTEVDGLECIGIGQDLAQYIIKPSYYPRMTEREVMILTAYALARVKEFVPGCGGHSQVLLMSNQDGSIRRSRPDVMQQQERRLLDCDRQMRTLLLAATNLEIQESQFEGCVGSFNGSVRLLRRECQAEKEFHDRVRNEARLGAGPGNPTTI
jgi:20S proteasome alpha/beta subunit